jgi:hypothetical protein
MTVLRSPNPVPGVLDLTGRRITASANEDIVRQAQVVEPILDRVVSTWRSMTVGKSNRWEQHREATIRAKETLLRADELQQNMGDTAPHISASELHSWVWSGASSLWQSSHFRSAVEDAAKKVNAETQNKIGRRDVSETKLFQEAFSIEPPVKGKSRLRRMEDDGSDTYKSIQRGAMALAEGIYAGIRNPLNHEEPMDLDEQTALEYLAALSVLARWVDKSSVETAK